jgi:hypothetical protein
LHLKLPPRSEGSSGRRAIPPILSFAKPLSIPSFTPLALSQVIQRAPCHPGISAKPKPTRTLPPERPALPGHGGRTRAGSQEVRMLRLAQLWSFLFFAWAENGSSPEKCQWLDRRHHRCTRSHFLW